jgi:uncharacterized protein DUF4154
MVIVVWAAVGGAARGQAPFENRLKAAIVTKIVQFVDWPPEALSGRAQVALCVVAPDPFGPDLAELVAGEKLSGRVLVTRLVDHDQDVNDCQVLYVPADLLAARASMLHAAAARPILTVSDAAGFLDAGGIVQLRQAGGRMRFEIDLGSAQKAGLRISSQLLQLALDVRKAQR